MISFVLLNQFIYLLFLYSVNIYLVQIKNKIKLKWVKTETDKQKLERIHRNLGKP